MPVGAGLGSSAAVAVCVASALLLYVGEIKPPTQGTCLDIIAYDTKYSL